MTDTVIEKNVKREQILIVDDVDKNVQLLAEILLSQGYDISPANSGEEALEALENGDPPDLILLDIMMPGISGIEVCRIIKNKPEFKDIPVIFLSAKTETESIVEGLRAGAIDYVTKPFNSEELLARVRVQVENIRLRKEILSVNRELEKNIVARDRLLSIIGHDLKSPLGSLQGLAQFYMDHDEKDIQFLKEFPNLVFKSLNSVLNLLANLLSWARLQGGHLVPAPENVDIYNALISTLEVMRQPAERKNIRIDLLSNEPARIWMDPNMLDTVLRNLISNAVKFTKSGGKIEIDYKKNNGEVELSIRDNGVGMEKQILDEIFRVDVRHQTQGTEKETGTGLGLVLCRDMLEKNNALIRAESEPGVGTVFMIKFKSEAKAS